MPAREPRCSPARLGRARSLDPPVKTFAKKLSKIHIYLTIIAEKSIIQIGFCYKDKVNKIKRIYNENMGFLLCYSGTTHFQSVFA